MDNNIPPSQINPLNSGPMFFGARPSKNKLIMLIVALVGGTLAAWWFLQPESTSSPSLQPTMPPAGNNNPTTAEEQEVGQIEAIEIEEVDQKFQPIDNDLNALGTPAANTQSLTVLGSDFKFSLSEIKVKKGDTVKINFKNVAGTHDWRIDAFNAGTRVLATGQEETIEFVSSKTGRFEYYCSVGTHRQMGMKGLLIVE